LGKQCGGEGIHSPESENPVDVEGQSVVVVGLARSGIAAARLLAGKGARVVATDSRPARELSEEALSLEASGARMELGGHERASFARAALVVVSPGVPWELPELLAARGAGVPVIAELELGYREIAASGARVAAVTGTKGKSTTTAALGAMLQAAGAPAFPDVRVGGNIGAPLCGMVAGATRGTTFVLEASSFQLEGTSTFRPQLAVFLNLSPDHLDRHASFQSYAAAKARVFRNQTPDDYAVVNADDPEVLRLQRAARARCVPFSAAGDSRGIAGDAAYFEAGAARLRRAGRDEVLFERASVRLPGAHLAADLLAAGAAARLLGAPAEAIARAVKGFEGVEHVLERVAEISGVVFFNDSKATNVAAAETSLRAMQRPALVIMGGRYKGGDFGSLRAALSEHARGVLAIGEAAPRIQEALADALPVTLCASLREAVALAFERARPGDAVLLAPGCSSFDMFADYAARGRAFKREVLRLPAKDGRLG
jgi:UDP-N-acetylmuramoylalanine--D-glutamate ligase